MSRDPRTKLLANWHMAGAKQAIGKRLQRRSIGAAAAPEFTPKRNSDTIRVAAGKDAEMPKIGESQVGTAAATDTCSGGNARA